MGHDLAQTKLPLAIMVGLFAGSVAIPRPIIRAALYIAKCLGLFRVARHLTRHGLRIICYHGFAVADEDKYRSTLFIRGDLFRRRIEYLRQHGYPILPLTRALDLLKVGQLPPCATVITMDDGWRGVYTVGLPVIKELDIPVTVYVTTYYIENPMPVFTVTASYLFWRCTSPRVVLPQRLGTFDLPAGAEKAEELTQQFGAVLPPTERLEFLKELASALQVSFDEIETQQLFRVMDGTELRALADAGIDIQLHSHHHQWPREARRRRCSSLATRRHPFSGARERVAWNGPSCSSARTCRGHYAGG